jgi:hypothetical protein
MPEEEARRFYDSSRRPVLAAWLFDGSGRGENLTAVLVADDLHHSLDVVYDTSDGLVERKVRALERGRRESGLWFVTKEDLTEIKILRSAGGRAEGSFSCSVPGVMVGRGLFVVARSKEKWTLAYLGIARKGSTNRTHGHAVFPRTAGPHRGLRDDVPTLPDLVGTVPGPPRDWVMLNVQGGEVWGAEDRTALDAVEMERVLDPVVSSDASLIVRCDASERWRYVGTLLSTLRSLGVRTVWFTIDVFHDETVPDHRRDEGFVEVRLPMPGHPEKGLEDKARRVLVQSGDEDTQSDTFRGLLAPDYARLRRRAEREFPVSDLRGSRVLLVPDEDTYLGWVLFVWQHLRRQGCADVRLEIPSGEDRR